MSKTIILSGTSSTMGVSPTDCANADTIARSSSPPVPVEKATVWSNFVVGEGGRLRHRRPEPDQGQEREEGQHRFMVTA